MGSTILVTGGTGRLGRHVVGGLRAADRDVRVLSRRGRRDQAAVEGVDYVNCDLLGRDGIDYALEGVDVIVHCAGSGKGDDLATRNLVEAASRAGSPHLVYISVVGADRVPVVSAADRAMFGYFAMKLAAERVVAGSGLPWTTLRATQFHDAFLALARAMTRSPVLPAPAGVRFQPIDEAEVAARLVELALGAPAGLVAEMAGPRVYTMADLLRAYLRASGKHRLIVPVPAFGGAASAIKAGANLAPDRAVGLRTWEDFLADRLGPGGEQKALAV